MTKKIDEAVSLNVTHTGDNGLTSNTTFTAEDTETLARVLKNAGLAGNSNQFNGPATLTVDCQEDGVTMSGTVNSPDLRSIMRLLEPEFQAVAQDAEISPEMPAEEPCVDCAADVAPEADVAVVPSDEVDMGMDLEEPVAEMTLDENEDDDVYDILAYICDQIEQGKTEGSEPFDLGDELAEIHYSAFSFVPDNYNADESEIQELMAKHDVEDPEQAGIWNDTEGREISFHYIIQTFGDVEESTEMQPYAGIADRKPVQPETKPVPARSGDNPLKSFREYVEEANTKNAPKAPVVKKQTTVESLMSEFKNK